ncbi:sensor histidine kinase [Chitinimonas sp. PSY-7]|uniref:histidine kinase n=1 Tax=Chitinimonas sp. PSY-7 TaxID=3459088 RepID=UPI00403FF6EE
MNTDQPSHNTAPDDQDPSKPASPPDTKQTLRMMRDGAVVLWWRFFDWLAVVPWKTLLIISLLVLILGGPFGADDFIFLLIIASFIVKILAGGKRKAELTATQATERAETETLERMVLEARMEALQAQIEPHFLFNTLASIDQLIQTDPPRASKMQQSLIRYLRSAMPQMRAGNRPSLGQQADLSSAFLEIMAVRMEERLQTKITVPEGLKSAVFPSLMLQTLVENAIKHGLEPKAEGGRLEISAEIVDGLLAVHVLDTGMGFMPKGGGGVGLANIRERLKVLYNGRAELIISVPPEGGTLATIKVPYEVVPLHTDATQQPSPA